MKYNPRSYVHTCMRTMVPLCCVRTHAYQSAKSAGLPQGLTSYSNPIAELNPSMHGLQSARELNCGVEHRTMPYGPATPDPEGTVCDSEPNQQPTVNLTMLVESIIASHAGRCICTPHFFATRALLFSAFRLFGGIGEWADGA